MPKIVSNPDVNDLKDNMKFITPLISQLILISSTPGLDPARPLVQNHGTQSFRLTRDDAFHVQLILTNAGFLGQSSLTGSINYCINGGRQQPYCSGNQISTS